MSDEEYQAGYQKALEDARRQQQLQQPSTQGLNQSTHSHTHHDNSHSHTHSSQNQTQGYSTSGNSSSYTGGDRRVDQIENKGERILSGGLHHDSHHPGHGGADDVVAGNFGGAAGVQDEKIMGTRSNVGKLL